MIGFLIKKSFYDLWDNLLLIALINLGFIASASIPLLLPSVLSGIPVLGFIVAIAGAVWCSIYLVTAALALRTLSNTGGLTFGDFFGGIRKSLVAGLILSVLVIAIAYCLTAAIPFYLAAKSTLGLMAAAMLFWMIVLALLTVQFFPTVKARFEGNPRILLRRCLEIFFDNTLFSIFTALANLVLLALSIFLAFLLPGPAGMLMFMDDAVRLRLLKYDWLKAHPEANRKRIPWEEILAEEREITGTRSLRNLIFPWKD